uniref:CMP/dCMP-type deaminase domain-containing protein n=1 Tax=viral metagenome TaxID=1070528 RepID=A0A6C0JW41_9ZZZZ
MTEKELKYHTLYLDIAERISQMSHARRLRVGALIEKNGTIISMGWNGTPKGFHNNCEHEYFDEIGNCTLETKNETIHAEMNAIGKLAENGISASGSNLYLTHSPCLECSKLIQRAGIKTVIYKKEYRNDNGIRFLKKCGVEIYKL